MGNVLDLTQFIEQYLTLKLPDGDTIKIKKPTERLKIKLMACVEEQIQLQAMGVKGEEVDESRQIKYIDMLEDLILAILNNNRDRMVFDLDYVQSYFGEVEMINALLLAYRSFIEETLSDPN